MKRRTKRQLDVFLRCVMSQYDGALVMHKGNKRRAKASVVRSYDDLQGWLYERDGD
jgi:hypothetical protein